MTEDDLPLPKDTVPYEKLPITDEEAWRFFYDQKQIRHSKITKKQTQKEKETVLEKLLENKGKENDSETIKTIDQVIEKLQTESFSEINYFKLKNLSEGL